MRKNSHGDPEKFVESGGDLGKGGEKVGEKQGKEKGKGIYI